MESDGIMVDENGLELNWAGRRLAHSIMLCFYEIRRSVCFSNQKAVP